MLLPRYPRGESRRMAVLVTGATGLVGTHLVNDLSETVFATSRCGTGRGDDSDVSEWIAVDLRDTATVQNIPWGEIDQVVHLAAYTDPRKSIDEPHCCFETNASGTSALLEAASDGKISDFVYVSSYWVYDSTVTGRIDESAPIQTDTPYGASKAAAELQCDAFREQSNMTVTTLRPFNVYGPEARDHQVVAEFVSMAIKTGVIEPHPGNPVRDFLYVDDFVNVITACLEESLGDVYNVGFGKGTSIHELAETVATVVEKHTGTEIETKFSGDQKPTDPKISDTTKLQSIINWKPATELEDGIEQLVQKSLNSCQ